MLVPTFLIHLLLVVSMPLSLQANPVPSVQIDAGMQNKTGSSLQTLLALLCNVKILNKLFCSNKGGNTATVSTPLGPATGVADTSTVGRFVVKYASAGRWQQSVTATTWRLP